VKKSWGYLVLALALVFVLLLPVAAFAKGGGGFSSGGGGRSFSGASSSGRSFSSGSKSFSSGSKGYSSSSKSYSSGSKSYSTSTKTYTNSSGKTITYTPKTYASSPRSVYNAPGYYGRPTNYYYTDNTGANIWFWLWLTGRNNQGLDAPKHSVQATATTDAGTEANKKAAAVAVPESADWGKYDAGSVFVIVLMWATFLGLIAFLIVGAVRVWAYELPFLFWKS
jgi:hypothetical protein